MKSYRYREWGHLRARARLKNAVTEVRKADMPNYPLTNKQIEKKLYLCTHTHTIYADKKDIHH